MAKTNQEVLNDHEQKWVKIEKDIKKGDGKLKKIEKTVKKTTKSK